MTLQLLKKPQTTASNVQVIQPRLAVRRSNSSSNERLGIESRNQRVDIASVLRLSMTTATLLVAALLFSSIVPLPGQSLATSASAQQHFYQPPVHASPTAGTVVSPRQSSLGRALPPVRPPGFPSAFKRSQLSSDHLFGPKGPSLQDKISGMFKSAPSPAAAVEKVRRSLPVARRTMPARADGLSQMQAEAPVQQTYTGNNVGQAIPTQVQVQFESQQSNVPVQYTQSHQNEQLNQFTAQPYPTEVNPQYQDEEVSFEDEEGSLLEAQYDPAVAVDQVNFGNQEDYNRARFEQQMKVVEQSQGFGSEPTSGLSDSHSSIPPAAMDPRDPSNAMRALIANEDTPKSYRRTPADYERLMNASRNPGRNEVLTASAQQDFGMAPGIQPGISPSQDPFNDHTRIPTPAPRRQMPARGISVMGESENSYTPNRARSVWQDDQETGQLPGPKLSDDDYENPIRDGQDRELDDLRKELDKLEEQAGEDRDPLNDDLLDGPEEDPSLDEDPEEDFQAPIQKSCDEFRNDLLNSSIRDISLDISPPRATTGEAYVAISRSWTDRSGNILGTGTMTDLRRGYVILDTGQKIPSARLSDSDLAALGEAWRIPAECTLGNQPFAGRNWTPQTFRWTASNLCHKPLYFENVQLERYGHSAGPFMQPIRSANHFFASLFLLPNQVATHSPTECQYALGYFRPGNCAPWLENKMSYSLNGVRAQAFFLTGAALLPP